MNEMEMRINNMEGLMNFMKENGYTSQREAIFDILFEFYECAGFEGERLSHELSVMTDAQLVAAFNNI